MVVVVVRCSIAARWRLGGRPAAVVVLVWLGVLLNDHLGGVPYSLLRVHAAAAETTAVGPSSGLGRGQAAALRPGGLVVMAVVAVMWPTSVPAMLWLFPIKSGRRKSKRANLSPTPFELWTRLGLRT